MEPHWVPAISAAVVIAATFTGVFISIGKIMRQIEELAVTVAAMAGKMELNKAELNDHKVYSAKEYVTNGELRDAVRAVSESIDRLGRDLKDYVLALTKRSD